MEINIQTPHFDAKASLLSYVKSQVDKLLTFDERLMKADVFLKLENTSDSDNKVCEIKLHMAGKDFFASDQCSSFEEAIARATEALERQIKHHKEKQEA